MQLNTQTGFWLLQVSAVRHRSELQPHIHQGSFTVKAHPCEEAYTTSNLKMPGNISNITNHPSLKL